MIKKIFTWLFLVWSTILITWCSINKNNNAGFNDNEQTLSGFIYLSWNINYNEDLWKKFFNYYNKLSNDFSPLVVDLYSDKASIKTKRYYPFWKIREITIEWTDWKKLLKKVLPLAKVKNDTSSFKNLVFIIEDDFIKIEGRRHSNLKDYDGQYYMIIKYEEWILKIVEEFSETKPM